MSASSSSFIIFHSAVPSTPDAFPSNLEVRASGCFRWSCSQSRGSFKLVHSSNVNCRSRFNCISSDAAAVETIAAAEDSKDFDINSESRFDGGGDIGAGGNASGGGGGGGGGDGNGDGEEEREFGPILKFVDVIKEADARGVKLPTDMLEAAKTTGIREIFLHRYLDLQVYFHFSTL